MRKEKRDRGHSPVASYLRLRRVSSRNAGVAVSDAARPGVCFTLKTQWPKLSPGGENVNACTPERDTDMGGGPTFHDNRVEVSAAG